MQNNNLSTKMDSILNQFVGLSWVDLTTLERNIMQIAMNATEKKMVLVGETKEISFKPVLDGIEF